MRLRYIHMHDSKPLNNISIIFSKEPILSRECAIRFVVGSNSSGKTRLLQAIADIFLCLKDNRLPPFPVMIAYDLGAGKFARTICINNERDSSKTVFMEFDKIIPIEEICNHSLESIEWRYPVRSKYLHGDLPGTGSIDSYLPKILLAYTSGDDAVWSSIFNGSFDGSDVLLDAPSLDKERPLNYRDKMGFDEIANIETGIFLDHDSLKLAICSTVLQQSKEEIEKINEKFDEIDFISRISESIESGKRMEGLRGLLNEIDWLWPVSIGFQISKPERIEQIVDQRKDLIRKLYEIATDIIQAPSDEFKDLLLFDLMNSLPDGTLAEILTSVISDGKKSTSFDIFKQLYYLHREGILSDITIAFRKRNLNDLLLLNWLSDGEQLFLGRMALFHLLKDQDDALIILDEPDTHFNDSWKREIVDIIDENFRNLTSDIIISTHSSIALTDVFDSEIILLRKNSLDGTIFTIPSPIRSFGASPNEIMLHIFDAPETVGQRAAEFLDLVLMLATYPDDVENIWAMEEDVIRTSPEFRKLKEHVKSLPYNYGDEKQLEKYLITTLISIYDYSKSINNGRSIRMIDVLSDLSDKIGAGYYQFEFRRRLRALRERDLNAA